MLSIEGLYKRFGDKEVIKGLNFHVPKNSIYGFVGTNGAGKTTTMKMVLGLLAADAGTILVDGERVTYGNTDTNRGIGYLPDVPEFYSFLTTREYLALCGKICGLSDKTTKTRSEELLKRVGLAGEKHRIKGFSRGMKQRLGIAQALINRPKLLICDEPTSALDPVGRKEILDILKEVREETTVLFSTHILSDVERICTDVAFLKDGVIALEGNIDQVRTLKNNGEFLVETLSPTGAEALCAHFPKAKASDAQTVTFTGNDDEMLSVMAFLSENNIPVLKVERAETSLEDLFMEVTKHE
ncbi:MAG: ABC transporter ATP-binding protein [Lachnospiraceae bacterium]|nr:ABC transporter ATP-binding protein [Lachnospiraceae bacterium]